jgi:hypothetical protein
MTTLSRRPPSFIRWFFDPETAARIEAAPPAPPANPRDSWPEWTDADTWELGPDPDDAPPQPSRADELYHLGFTLGLDREDATAPEGSTPPEARAFDAGWLAGKAEWDRRLEEMCGAAEYADFSGSLTGGPTDADIWPGGVC